jgi:hypothetical protein
MSLRVQLKTDSFRITLRNFQYISCCEIFLKLNFRFCPDWEFPSLKISAQLLEFKGVNIYFSSMI